MICLNGQCAVEVIAPAGDGLVGFDGARMANAGGDGGVLALRGACSTPAVCTPAGDGLVGSDSAGVVIADGDCGVLAWWCVGLAQAVPAPAGDGLVGLNSAGVVIADGDRGVLAWWCVGLLKFVPAPAGDGLVGSDSAGVVTAGGDGVGYWAGTGCRRGWGCGRLAAAAGDEFGVDVEHAAVGVEHLFLGGNKIVADFQIGICRVWRCWPRHYLRSRAAARHRLKVDLVQAAVGIGQVLLSGNQHVPLGDVRRRRRGHRRGARGDHGSSHQSHHNDERIQHTPSHCPHAICRVCRPQAPPKSHGPQSHRFQLWVGWVG